MTTFRTFVFAALFLANCAVSGGEIGRYQVISATVTDPETGKPESVLIKLDTVTGDVWKFKRAYGPTPDGRGMLIEGWMLISGSIEESMESYEKLKQALKDGR